MTLSSGVYSLIGVAVGGGVTWATQWQLAARNDRLDTRVARRQVRAELRRHKQAADSTIRARVRSDQELEAFITDFASPGAVAWTKHSDRLARQLSDPDWDAVEQAYEDKATLTSTMREERRPASGEELERIGSQIDYALARLS